MQEEHQPDGLSQIIVAGKEDKGHQPPELPVSDGVPVEGQKTDGAVSGKDGENIHHGIADDDVFHQVRDAKVGVVIRKAVHRVVELFQSEPSKSEFEDKKDSII